MTISPRQRIESPRQRIEAAKARYQCLTDQEKQREQRSKPKDGQRDMFSRIAAAKVNYERGRGLTVAYRKQEDESGEHWITIGVEKIEGDGEHHGGTHVKITKSGQIVAGPEALAKKGIHNLSDFGKVKDHSSHESEPKHDQPAERSGNDTDSTGTENAAAERDRSDGDSKSTERGNGHSRTDGSGDSGGGDAEGSRDPVEDTRLDGGPQILTARAEHTQLPTKSQLAEGVSRHLSDDQKHGAELAIESMDKRGGFLLADGTGIGKTRQVLAVAKHYADAGHKVLIVAPSEVLKPDWKKKTVAGSYADDGTTMGVSPELVKGEDGLAAGKVRMTTYGELTALQKNSAVDKNTIVLFDEAHGLKNLSSAQGSAGMDIASDAKSVLFATATPADKPDHLNYLMRAGVFHGMKKDVLFPQLGLKNNKFFNPHTGREQSKWEVDPKVGKAGFVKRLGVLFDSLTSKGAMIKRELSLEGVGVKSQEITMPPEVHEQMDEVAKTIERESRANSGLTKAAILGAQRRIQEPYKIPAAVDAVKDALANGRQAIVFVQRINDSTVGKSQDADENITSGGTAPALKKALEEAGITDIAEIHGGNKGKGKAAEAMNRFQSGSHRVVIATVESGGTGINLDDRAGNKPRTTIMMTPPLGATPYMQALGRSHRKTTRSKSNVVNLYGDTPVEKWNRAIIDSKLSSLHAITGSNQHEHQADDIGELANLSGDEIESMAASGDLEKSDRDAAKEARENEALDRLRSSLGMKGSRSDRVEAAAKSAENKAEKQSRSSESIPHQKHLDLVQSRVSDKKPIRFRGNTFAHKDAIKNLGASVNAFAKWDGDAKVWRIEPQWASDKDKLAKGLHKLAQNGVEAYSRTWTVDERIKAAKSHYTRLTADPTGSLTLL